MNTLKIVTGYHGSVVGYYMTDNQLNVLRVICEYAMELGKGGDMGDLGVGLLGVCRPGFDLPLEMIDKKGDLLRIDLISGMLGGVKHQGVFRMNGAVMEDLMVRLNMGIDNIYRIMKWLKEKGYITLEGYEENKSSVYSMPLSFFACAWIDWMTKEKFGIKWNGIQFGMVDFSLQGKVWVTESYYQLLSGRKYKEKIALDVNNIALDSIRDTGPGNGINSIELPKSPEVNGEMNSGFIFEL